MNKEVKEYLDYLKANEYIWGYEKKDNYIILRYGLSSVKDTEINIEYNYNLQVFLNNILAKANDIENVLINGNDYYGYNTREELNSRIEEEKYFLKSMVGVIFNDR